MSGIWLMIFGSIWVYPNILFWKINSSVRDFFIFYLLCVFNYLSRFKLTFFISIYCWKFNTIWCYIFWFQSSCLIKNSLCFWFVLNCCCSRKFLFVLNDMFFCIFLSHIGSAARQNIAILIVFKIILTFHLFLYIKL